MSRRVLCWLMFVLVQMVSAQNQSKFSVGFNHGVGSEFNNRNYTFTNKFYKAQINYSIKEGKFFDYEVLIQPEINFGSHQLLNFYFVKPEEENFQNKRDQYTKLKDVQEYVLNIGFIIRKLIFRNGSVYALLSVGPLFTDTETERMSAGFAFADVAAIGFSYQIERFVLDLRPSVRHVSNAGLQSKNSGYNTKNIEFGVTYKL